jgi:ABC-type multidrug transport system permease subunit
MTTTVPAPVPTESKTQTKSKSKAKATRGPSVVYLGWHRGLIELKGFFRERDAVVFTFALPAVLLALLGSLFSGVYEGSTVTSAQYLVPSMIAAGVASTTFVNLGISVAADREDGTLKRLRGAPMPAAAYFLGKVIMVLVVTVAEVVILLGIGALLFDITLPTDPARWATFAWVFVLGVAGCSFLGIAASSFAKSERSAGAVMNLPYIALSFVSGIFYTPISALPDGLLTAGSLFPLKWMAQGFRSVFLPDTILAQEVVNSWEHGRTALILAAWCIGGLVLCLTTFRWRGRRDG